MVEDDDQRGLAHFVEHMAVNGTEHFPKQQVVSLLESLGMRFGGDVNAYTSFDETVFMLTVPTDKPETMDKSLVILGDGRTGSRSSRAKSKRNAAWSWRNGAAPRRRRAHAGEGVSGLARGIALSRPS